MKRFTFIFLMLLFVSCTSTYKFARTDRNSYQHETINTIPCSDRDIEYVYKHIPLKYQRKIDNKEVKIHKVIQPGAHFYILIDKNHIGLITARDIIYHIKKDVPLTLLEKYKK